METSSSSNPTETDEPDWAALVRDLHEAELSRDAERMRSSYGRLLGEFPLCYGYWKRLADFEVSQGSVEQANQVFERAIVLGSYCVELWAFYGAHAVAHWSRPDDVRALFERGASYVGSDYGADIFWNRCVQAGCQPARPSWFKHATARLNAACVRFPAWQTSTLRPRGPTTIIPVSRLSTGGSYSCPSPRSMPSGYGSRSLPSSARAPSCSTRRRKRSCSSSSRPSGWRLTHPMPSRRRTTVRASFACYRSSRPSFEGRRRTTSSGSRMKSVSAAGTSTCALSRVTSSRSGARISSGRRRKLTLCSGSCSPVRTRHTARCTMHHAPCTMHHAPCAMRTCAVHHAAARGRLCAAALAPRLPARTRPRQHLPPHPPPPPAAATPAAAPLAPVPVLAPVSPPSAAPYALHPALLPVLAPVSPPSAAPCTLHPVLCASLSPSAALGFTRPAHCSLTYHSPTPPLIHPSTHLPLHSPAPPLAMAYRRAVPRALLHGAQLVAAVCSRPRGAWHGRRGAPCTRPRVGALSASAVLDAPGALDLRRAPPELRGRTTCAAGDCNLSSHTASSAVPRRAAACLTQPAACARTLRPAYRIMRRARTLRPAYRIMHRAPCARPACVAHRASHSSCLYPAPCTPTCGSAPLRRRALAACPQPPLTGPPTHPASAQGSVLRRRPSGRRTWRRPSRVRASSGGLATRRRGAPPSRRVRRRSLTRSSLSSCVMAAAPSATMAAISRGLCGCWSAR